MLCGTNKVLFKIATSPPEKMYTNLVRDLIHGYTSDVEKGRVLFRSVG